jgi:hypothetical protein
MGRTAFQEVTKEKFKEIYFRLGRARTSGWTADYWEKFFEHETRPGWRFMVEEPASPDHDSMTIVTDIPSQEYRMFFMTEEAVDDMYDYPGKE